MDTDTSTKRDIILESQGQHMLVTSSSPEFLPYLGFWNRLLRSDVCILIDNCRFRMRHYQNRNRIRDCDGWAWLSIPVHGGHNSYLSDVETVSHSATMNSWKVAEASYRGRAEYWDVYCDKIKGFLDQQYLLDINLSLIKYLSEELDIQTEFKLASSVLPNRSEDRHVFALHLAQEIGGTAYLSSVGNIGMHSKVPELDIQVRFQNFVCLPYPQVFQGYHPRMSILDCLVTHGAEYTRRIIEGGYRNA